MSTNHNRIKVSDLETNLPNKILVTNQSGELTFTDAGNIGLDASNFKKENFEFTGSKIFTLSEPALNVLSVVVDGIILNGTVGAPLQYRMNTSTSLEILDEMVLGEDFWVSITYNYAGSIDGEPGPGNYTADQITETANRKFQSANQRLFNDATSSIQTQLDTKEQAIPSGVASQYFRGDKTWQTHDKTSVGLGNVDNTTDAAKNVLSATKLAAARTINGVAFDGSANITINAVDATSRIASSEKGAANGVATLDASGIIATSQLPSYVDDVLEFTNLAAFPATGETGKIYVAKDTNKTYRWSGTAYVYITSGAVDSVAGKTGVVTLAKADVGLANVDNTADASKNVLSATKLTTARTINGVAFDGSANITVTDSTKENSIAAGTTSQYFRGDKTWQAHDKTSVGLNNVDNTADAAKNVLSATKLAAARTINGVAFDGSANITVTDSTKENSIAAGTTAQYFRGDKTWQTLNTAGVPESGNLYFTNTRTIASTLTGYTSTAGTISATDTILSAINKLNGNDALKAPIASPTFTGTVTAPSFVGAVTGNATSATKLATARTINGVAFDGSANITINAVDATARIASSEKGAVNGVATLDASGIIPTSQLPSYVDDVLEFTNLAGFPATGETGKIYVAKDTNKTYRWSGTAYVYITSGAVDSVAGKTGVVALVKADVGLANADNTADAAKNVLSATKLTTPRTINGVSFDGSVNITIADSTKENSIAAGTTSQYWRGDKTWQALTTANVPESGNLYFSNARSIASVLTGYTSTAGTIAATDSILSAINKLNGNDALKAPLASPTFTGTVTAPAFSGALTGNASTATRLQTTRTINGISFDGSANITIPTNNTDKVPHQDGTRSDLNYNSAVTASGFYNVNSTGTNGPGSSYNNLIVAKGIDTGLQIAGGHNNDSLWFRGWSSNGTTFTPWRRVLHEGNYNSYSPTLTGTGANGNWGINITGSAGGSSRYVDLLANRTDVAAYPILWGVNQGTNPMTGNASTYAFSCDAVKIQSSTGTVIANNFSGNGTGLTGTAGSLSIGGNAETSTSARRITFTDGPRNLSDRLPNTFARSVNFDFVNAATVGGSGNYGGVMTFAPWDGLSASTGDSSYQLAFRNESGINGSGLPGLRLRKGIDTTWGGWYDILHSGNYASYSAFSGAITGASLTVSGDVTAFSDARVKENIRPIENVIERIQASRGVVYDRIDNDQKDNIGFIAQELEENFPELVLTREDGTKAVKYQNAVAVLFEAVKKQQTQIEEQDQKMKLILEHLNLKL